MDGRGTLARWRSLPALVMQRRRLVVAGLTGIAVLSGLTALRPSPAPTRRVWVAAHDLSGGAPLTAGDVRAEQVPAADVPADALPSASSVIGRLLAAPMRRGEPFTDVRILSAALLGAAGAAGDVAVPVRVTDGPATLALVQAGDDVDILAAPDPDGTGPPAAFTVVRDVRVLATPAHDDSATAADSDDPGGVLIVEATDRQAATLARAAAGTRLSVAVRRAP